MGTGAEFPEALRLRSPDLSGGRNGSVPPHRPRFALLHHTFQRRIPDPSLFAESCPGILREGSRNLRRPKVPDPRRIGRCRSSSPRRCRSPPLFESSGRTDVRAQREPVIGIGNRNPASGLFAVPWPPRRNDPRRSHTAPEDDRPSPRPDGIPRLRRRIPDRRGKRSSYDSCRHRPFRCLARR